MELEMPSKTDSPEVDQTVHEPTSYEREHLSQGEQGYLRSLEEKNRYLTMLLGDKVVEAESAKKELLEHRESLKQAYVSILKVHGVSEGRIDTSQGLITVLVRTPKE